MKKIMLIVLILFTLTGWTQTSDTLNMDFYATVYTGEEEAMQHYIYVSDMSYPGKCIVVIEVTPKTATRLLVERIKARRDNTISIPSGDYILRYLNGVYLWSYSGVDIEFSNIKEARKQILYDIRFDLGIIG